jgi:hypothetical protein
MRYRVTERYVYGVANVKALWGSPDGWPPGLVLWPFDAERRGYDMAIYRPAAVTGGYFYTAAEASQLPR